MESISKSEEPGLFALAEKAPDVVKKMGKDPNDIKMMRGGEVEFGHGGKVGGCNTGVQVSGLKNGADLLAASGSETSNSMPLILSKLNGVE